MTNSRRMTNARTMTFFAVVSSSLLFLFILDLATIIGVHAQKELAFEQNPPSLVKTTTRTPETITTEDDDDTKNTDAYGSKRGGEWTFATPASKGLSQSSLEVRSFFLYLSLFWNLIRESRGSIWRSGNICHPLLPLSLSLSLSLSFNHLLAIVSSFFRSSF